MLSRSQRSWRKAMVIAMSAALVTLIPMSESGLSAHAGTLIWSDDFSGAAGSAPSSAWG